MAGKGKKKMTQEGQEKEKEEGEMEVGTEASSLQQKGKKMNSLRKRAVGWLFLSLVMSEDEFSRSVSEMSIGQVSVPDCV